MRPVGTRPTMCSMRKTFMWVHIVIIFFELTKSGWAGWLWMSLVIVICLPVGLDVAHALSMIVISARQELWRIQLLRKDSKPLLYGDWKMLRVVCHLNCEVAWSNFMHCEMQWRFHIVQVPIQWFWDVNRTNCCIVDLFFCKDGRMLLRIMVMITRAAAVSWKLCHQFFVYFFQQLSVFCLLSSAARGTVPCSCSLKCIDHVHICFPVFL